MLLDWFILINHTRYVYTNGRLQRWVLTCTYYSYLIQRLFHLPDLDMRFHTSGKSPQVALGKIVITIFLRLDSILRVRAVHVIQAISILTKRAFWPVLLLLYTVLVRLLLIVVMIKLVAHHIALIEVPVQTVTVVPITVPLLVIVIAIVVLLVHLLLPLWTVSLCPPLIIVGTPVTLWRTPL